MLQLFCTVLIWATGALAGFSVANTLYGARLKRLRFYIEESQRRETESLKNLKFKLALVDPRHAPDVSTPGSRGAKHRV